MHSAPSEASILRTLYEKEAKDHKTTQGKLNELCDLITEYLREHDSALNTTDVAKAYANRLRANLKAAVKELKRE